MSATPSLRAFKCPTCGAPLEPEAGTLTMKCSYCGSTVIIPESLRTAPPSSGPTMGQVFDFGLRGLDMNKIVGNAMQLPQAIQLAKQGRIDEAANIYSQITGMEHDDAVRSIEAMAAGHAVSLTTGAPGYTWPGSPNRFSQPGTAASTTSSAGGTTSAQPSSSGRSCGLLVGIIAAVVVLVGVLIGGGLYMFSGTNPLSSTNPLASGLQIGFASKQMSFGGQGIGPGLFQDPRNIGLDGNGNITVADYEDGRIQTFSPSGKFISGFTLTSKSGKPYVSGLSVGRDGTIYVAHDWEISSYSATGKEMKSVGDDNHRYEGVVMGADGKLYAVENEEGIVRFAPDLSVDLEIPQTFSKITGNQELDSKLAVDGQGNMYLVGSFNYLVLKYSPDGTFVDQFGGEAKDASVFQPGKFVSPGSVAVDGYGRIYVADFGSIQVFVSSGTYVNSINSDNGAIFGMVFDDQNNLYTITNQSLVAKYKIQAPAGN